MRSTPLKARHRALFLALQADAKEHPHGIAGLADHLGINGNTLANGLNPDHDAPPPSFSVIVEIVVHAQARRSVFALAQLVGQLPMDFQIEQRDSAQAVKLFLRLVSSASKLLDSGSEAAQDGRFCADDRRELEPLLMCLLKATAELLHSIRGAA